MTARPPSRPPLTPTGHRVMRLLCAGRSLGELARSAARRGITDKQVRAEAEAALRALGVAPDAAPGVDGGRAILAVARYVALTDPRELPDRYFAIADRLHALEADGTLDVIDLAAIWGRVNGLGRWESASLAHVPPRVVDTRLHRAYAVLGYLDVPRPALRLTAQWHAGTVGDDLRDPT